MKASLIAAVAAALLAAAQPAQAGGGGAGASAYRMALGEPPAGAAFGDGFDSAFWSGATSARLGWNLRLQQPARELTRAWLASDRTYLYVKFEAKQDETIMADQHADNLGADLDDEVEVILWPGGGNGFRYSFVATPLGTHYQFSSENAVFEPSWTSRGRLTDGGYTVAMRLPLGALRGAGSAPWRVQLVRLVQQTRDVYVWSFGARQGDFADLVYAGEMEGIGREAAAGSPKARFAPYALAQAGAERAGGNTSRAGMDLSVPYARQSSFYATLHPDYSNVAADQAIIQQSAFRLPIQDYRPFFTQAASFYNTFTCLDCPGVTELYTPAIPIFRDGYAVEGKVSAFSYAAFVASATARSDSAQVVSYRSPDQRLSASFQRVAADLPGLHDDTAVAGMTFDNHSDLLAYANYGIDRGTRVRDAAQAQRADGGARLYGPTWYLDASLQRFGAEYDPVDGFVAHPDIAGYDVTASRTLNFAPRSAIKQVTLAGGLDRYHQHDGRLDQTDNFLSFELETRSTLRLHVTSGSDYVMVGDGDLVPAQQSGVALSYLRGTSTPQTFAFNSGRFGRGTLYSWLRMMTLKAGRRGILTLRADDTDQLLDSGGRVTQWLERATFSYQPRSDTALSWGVRRLIGAAPVLAGAPQPVNACNLYGGVRKRFAHSQLDLVYGDASTLRTVPKLILRIVQFIGAEKGV